MFVAHLAASSFLGGIESQILGLIGTLPSDYQSALFSFSEQGRCRPLLNAAARLGADVVELKQNTPHYRASVNEISSLLRNRGVDLLCCHGYKPDILGLLAAKRAGIPVISVSHGWTGATCKVRINELVDRLCLHGMDHVVCVSQSQAKRVQASFVRIQQVTTIPNSIDTFQYLPSSSVRDRDELVAMFDQAPDLLIGSAGRLSPEKGYLDLVEAAALTLKSNPNLGYVHFGDGPSRLEVADRISRHGLNGRFILAGFRNDLAQLLPQLDLFVLPSYTEGLPCVVLESFACGVPVVATAVGGTPEVVKDGVNGRSVPAGKPDTLASAILDVLSNPNRARTMGEQGRAMVLEHFTFDRQSMLYQTLFSSLIKAHDKQPSTH